MQIKNSIVIIDEINARLAAGDAPLVGAPFYSAMAVTVMCGLAFATLLTMVITPVNYALFFRLRKPN